jgi:zinc protease
MKILNKKLRRIKIRSMDHKIRDELNQQKNEIWTSNDGSELKFLSPEKADRKEALSMRWREIKRGKRFFIFVFLLIALPCLLQSSFRREEIKVHQLENGLKILLLEDHTIPNIALYTFFRVGSRNERPGLTGVSHFIEHMMFNGTQKFGPGEFDRLMEFKGGSNNAYTSDDMTVYTDWFPAEALEKILEMEADRMQGLIFDPQVFESERGVVASERRMSVENNNEALLYENVRATAIQAHPYHWDVIGWMSDILSWRREEVIAYYRTYYAPNNAVLVMVGDFQPDKALELIKKYYGPIKPGPPPPPVTTTEPPQLGPRRVEIRKEAQTPSFLLAFHAPRRADPDFYGLSVLEKVLFHGESSRLYRRLVREEQLAIDISGGLEETMDPFLFLIFVKPRPGADLSRIEKVIEEELNKIKNQGIEPKEFEKALNIIRSSFYRQLQTISGKANLLGWAELILGSYEKLFTIIDEYNAVKREALPALAARYFDENKKTVGWLIPQGGEK